MSSTTTNTEGPGEPVIVIEVVDYVGQPLEGASGKTYGVFSHDPIRTELYRRRGGRGAVSVVRLTLAQWNACKNDLFEMRRRWYYPIPDFEFPGMIEAARMEINGVAALRDDKAKLEREVAKLRADISGISGLLESARVDEPPSPETVAQPSEAAPEAEAPAPKPSPTRAPKTGDGKPKKY